MQVYCNKQLVGEFNAPALQPGARFYTVALMEASPVYDYNALPDGAFETRISHRHLDMPIGGRNCSIDERELTSGEHSVDGHSMALADLFSRYKIPVDATRTKDPMGGLRLSWKVFDLDVETYEQVFDLPQFEPV